MVINSGLRKQLDDIAEVASYLWTRGWAERNGGNITVNVTEVIGDENKNLPSLATYPLPRLFKGLAGDFFFATGTGCRMRNVGKDILNHGSIIRINSEGTAFDIIGENPVKPTSELPSHLSIHQSFKEKGNKNKVVVHTHTTDLIALTHIEKFNKDAKLMSKMLWGMLPETFILVPRGLGIVPYDIPGTLDLADRTLKALEHHDFVMWEKHGILGVGEEIIEVFDLIDTLSKSAQVYQFAKSCGYEPLGLTDEEVEGLIEPFGIVI